MSGNSADRIDFEALDRYLAGESSQEETRTIQELLGASPDAQQELGALSHELHAGGAEPNRAEISASFERLRAKIGVEVPSPVRSESRQSRSSFWYLGIAAGIIIAVVGVRYLPNFINPGQSVGNTRTYATSIGQQANVQLTDGSRIILAPATTMRVTGRNIELTGEAVFTVSHKTGESFTVRTSNSITQVLGTRFVVRQYGEEEAARVAVSDGRVSVNSSILNSGDMVVADIKSSNVTHNTNVAAMLSWTTGTLHFDKTPLAQVLPELARWYNVEFVAADPSLLNLRLSATLSTNGLTPAVLDLITSSLGVRYARVGRIVTLYPGH